MFEGNDLVDVDDVDAAPVRVVATTMLKDAARERLSEQMGPGFVVLDIRKAPRSADIVIAPVVSEQTISALKEMFPKARVVLTEVQDRDWEVSRSRAAGRQRRS